MCFQYFILDFSYDNRTWMNNRNNSRGNRSPYDMGDWGWDGPSNRGGNNDNQIDGGQVAHCIHMRGLPFKATEMDIADASNFTTC